MSSGKWIRTSFFWLLIGLAVVLVIVFFFRQTSDTTPVTVSSLLSTMKTDIQSGHKDTLDVGTGTITLTRADGSKESANINTSFDVTQVLKDNGINYANNPYLSLSYDSPSALNA